MGAASVAESVYKLAEVRDYLDRLVRVRKADGNLEGFVTRSARFLTGLGSPEATQLGGFLQASLAAGRRKSLLEAVRGIAREDGLLAQVAPVAVDSLVRLRGEPTLERLIAGSAVPRFDPSDLLQARRGLSDDEQLLVLWAAQRQADVWGRLQALTGPVPMEQGSLTWSGGDADATNTFLVQQGLFFQPAGRRPSHPLFVAVMSRGGNVAALRYTAGKQKTGLPIHPFPVPFRTTAFSETDAAGLIDKFLLHLITPTSDRIEEVLTPALFRVLPTGSLVVYDTKGFSLSGDDIDQRVATLLRETGRDQDNLVDAAFLAGFTGARGVFSGELPELPDDRRKGLRLGIGVTNLEVGRRFASVLTGVLPGEMGSQAAAGGSVTSLARSAEARCPLQVYIYSDPDLRRAQELWAIYKNVYSGILGQRLFEFVFGKLDQAGGQVTGDLISGAENFYRRLMGKAREELEQILTRVEGVRQEKIEILPPSEVDALESWRVRDMGLFVNLVKMLFFDIFEGDQRSPTKITYAVGEWRSHILDVFATRNPAAGATVAALREARQYQLDRSDDGELILRLEELVPQRPDRSGPVTFEGMASAARLEKRLSPEVIGLLPELALAFVAETRRVWQPQPLPQETREGLILVASLLATWSADGVPGREEQQAYFHRAVTDAELKNTVRWRGTLTFNDFAQTVRSIRIHLENGLALITRRGKQHARLSRRIIEQVTAMTIALSTLERVAQETNGAKPLEVAQLRQLMHALTALITEGNRIYLDEDFRGVMADLLYRMNLIFAYLETHRSADLPRGQQVARPYPADLTGPRPRIPLWKKDG